MAIIYTLDRFRAYIGSYVQIARFDHSRSRETSLPPGEPLPFVVTVGEPLAFVVTVGEPLPFVVTVGEPTRFSSSVGQLVLTLFEDARR